MRTFFKKLALGTTLAAVSGLSAFAQDAAQGKDLETLFNEFKAERKKACGTRDAAQTIGKEIVDRFSNDPLNEQVINFVKEKMPVIAQEDADCKLTNAYNESYKTKNWDQFFTVSKQVMAKHGETPTGIDVLLTHVGTGYDQAVANNDKYNAETLSYAKQAIQKLEGGKTGNTWGTYSPFKSKEDALAWMNYTAGFIHLRNKQNKEAVPFLYKATTYKADPQSDPLIYQAIGVYYFDEATKLYNEFTQIREANNKTDNDESKAKLALARGYADRAIDAFGRAKKFADANPKTPLPLKETLNRTLTELYKFRFDGKTEGQDAYVSSMISKPMPDPNSAVAPVVETVAPTTTTGTSTTTPATTAPSSTKAATTKQPLSSTTTTATPATTAATKPAPAKKAVVKKKGTR